MCVCALDGVLVECVFYLCRQVAVAGLWYSSDLQGQVRPVCVCVYISVCVCVVLLRIISQQSLCVKRV